MMHHFEHTVAFIQNVSPFQLLIVLFLILLLFGAKRLPELARGIGKALREFKSATRDIEDDFRSAMNDEEKPKKSGEAKSGKEMQPDEKQPEPASREHSDKSA